jgi:5-methylcytosine-specific restriction endonuclease McrA
MAFSETTKQSALRRAGNKCQRCKTPLTMATAQFHHKLSVEAGGSDGDANCEVLCRTCHKNTRSYGQH